MSATRALSRKSVHCRNTDSTVSHRGAWGSRGLRRGRVSTSTGFRAILSRRTATCPRMNHYEMATPLRGTWFTTSASAECGWLLWYTTSCARCTRPPAGALAWPVGPGIGAAGRGQCPPSVSVPAESATPAAPVVRCARGAVPSNPRPLIVRRWHCTGQDNARAGAVTPRVPRGPHLVRLATARGDLLVGLR